MKNCPFIPLYDRIVFEEVTQESSVIHLPKGADSGEESKLMVIAVGEGKVINGVPVPLKVKVGDQITLTSDAVPRISKHYIGPDKEKDVIFSVQEAFIAGIYR